jgi:hypothetical protein
MCVSGAVAGISARLLVHGGVGYEDLSDEVRLLRLPVDDRTRARIVLSDLHVLEPSTGTWSQPELCGWPATRRAFHSMHSLDGRILLLGGRDGFAVIIDKGDLNFAIRCDEELRAWIDGGQDAAAVWTGLFLFVAMV